MALFRFPITEQRAKQALGHESVTKKMSMDEVMRCFITDWGPTLL